MNRKKRSLLIEEVVPKDRILYDEPMSRHTTMQVGGKVDFLVLPSSTMEIAALINLVQGEQIPYFILGRGSNLIVRDGGFRGLIIKIGEPFSSMRIEDSKVIAGAGISLASLARTCADHELSGLEFAFGIPGSLGGAIVMNAGAYGHEVTDILTHVQYINEAGVIFTEPKETLKFGYRESIFMHNPWIILGGEFKLFLEKKEEINRLMAEYTQRRNKTQPLRYPSAGSIFKRPPGAFAGPLIEQAGLKGYTIGKAQVSALHAGFIVNLGGASAKDILALIMHIQDIVWAHNHVKLEPEVRIIGEE